MAGQTLIPAGDFRTSYAADTTVFPTSTSRNAMIVGIVLICFAPHILNEYSLSLLIQIGIFAIAALGLNIVVGFTGQISIGHAAFFGFGAFTSAYLSAEIMGINLTKYRTLSFGLAAFFAGVGGALYAHYNQVVSNEGFGIDRSIIFLAMIIIGGLGSIMGTLMGTAFMVLLPESMEWLSVALRDSPIDQALGLKNNIAFLREMAIGVIIIIFLIFEPDGLAHRWRQIKAYWKLYPFSH